MFTRDSKILSHRLTTPLTSVANAVGDVFKPTYNQIIKSLFANNEQGFFYDPNDLTTMFQDAAGTVPVTAVGQPVGLILDKSKGLTLKPIAMLNSGFDLNLSGWVAGPTLTASWSNGQVRIVGTGAIESVVNTFRSSESGSANKLYNISFDATWVSGGYLQAGAPYSEGLRVLPTENAGIKKRYSYQLAMHPVSPYNICCFAAESGAVWLIDNVSIKEITGNHAYQNTSASRPILRQNTITGAYYLEFDGSDDFLQTNNIDFTGTDKVSLFAGVRKLSDATSVILVELSNSTLANNGAFHIEAPSGQLTNNYGFASKGTIRQIAQSVASYPSPNSAVLVGIGVISTDTELLRINGIQSASSAGDQGVGNYGNYPLYIGRRGGTSLPFNGHIYGLIGIGKLTSDNETVAIEKELAKRTGVTLSV